MSKLTDFGKGFLLGAVFVSIIFGFTALMFHLRSKDREVIEYVERQIEIEAMREDVVNRDSAEFLEIPDVRRAADGAAAEFERKRDEALHRFRGRLASRAGLTR